MTGAGREELRVGFVQAALLDVLCEQCHQPARDVDGALGPVLRWHEGGRRSGALHLTTDCDGAAEEIEVLQLQPGRFAQA